MTRLTATSMPNVSLDALSYFGLPNPLDWLFDVDGDPDHIEERTEAFADADELLGDASDSMSSGAMQMNWQGPAFERWDEWLEVFSEGVTMVFEWIVWAVEVVIQIIDYIITLFRLILNLALIVISLLSALAAATAIIIAGLLASVFGAAKVPAVFKAAWAAAKSILGTGLMTKAGIAGAFATLFALLGNLLQTYVIDGLVETLQDFRESLGGRAPDLPDWDPDMPQLPT